MARERERKRRWWWWLLNHHSAQRFLCLCSSMANDNGTTRVSTRRNLTRLIQSIRDIVENGVKDKGAKRGRVCLFAVSRNVILRGTYEETPRERDAGEISFSSRWLEHRRVDWLLLNIIWRFWRSVIIIN